MEGTCLGFVRLDPSYLFRILKLDVSKPYSQIVLTENRQDFPNLEKIPVGIPHRAKRGFLEVRHQTFQNPCSTIDRMAPREGGVGSPQETFTRPISI